MLRSKAALLALLLASLTLPSFAAPIAVSSVAVTTAKGVYPSGERLADDSKSTALELCDCEPATGGPYGLSCEKEGYFISDFEREGQWLAGGGLVPLSRAICCRPCLPKRLPPQLASPSGHDNVSTAVAVVSIGCHKSAAIGAAQLLCDTPASLVAGYAEANRVSAALDAFYPTSAAECCTPSILLSNGDAWELERCECDYGDGINCGSRTTHRLLVGYEHWRMTFATQYVPVAPAKCCKMCLSGSVHRMDVCADQNMCSGRGVCILGQCECLGGWRGADCSTRPAGSSDKDLPNWAVGLIVSGACIGVSILLALVGKLLRHYDILSGSEESEVGDPAAEALLAGLEDEVGSVGSQDTTDTDTDTEAAIEEVASATQQAGDAGDRTAELLEQVRLEAVERLILESQQRFPDDLEAGIEYAMQMMHAVISDAEQGNAEAVAEAMRAVEAPLAETIRATYRAEAARQARHAHATAAAAAGAASRGAQQPLREGTAAAGGAAEADERGAAQAGAGQSDSPQHTVVDIQGAQPQRQAHAQPAIEPGGGVTDDEEEDVDAAASKAQRKAQLLEEGRRQSQAAGPLAALDCSVCLTRAIQVVVIPCGHACMCRRCSRRLHRCPICRREVVRRQRLFVGG